MANKIARILRHELGLNFAASHRVARILAKRCNGDVSIDTVIILYHRYCLMNRLDDSEIMDVETVDCEYTTYEEYMCTDIYTVSRTGRVIRHSYYI